MADPKIKYDIEANVTGEADIKDFAQQLEDVAKVLGGDLSPAAKAAAAEMRALGQQQSAITAFAQLSEQVKASERDLSLAQKSAKSFVTEISAAGPPTAQQAAALTRLNEQVQSSQTKLTGQKDAVYAANQELLKYGLTGDRLIEAQRQTAASVDTLKASVQASIPAFKAAGTEGASSARQIQDAWSTLGVKSFTQTQTEIAKVKTALETVKATSKSPLEIKIATEAAQAQIKQLEGGVNSVGTATSGVSGMLRQLGPLMATAFSAQQFIGTIVAAESLSRSYEQIFGSTAKARQEMEFIKVTANRLGLETLDLAKSYQSLAASTKGTVMEGQATRDMFEAVARAMSTLGKSSEEADRALTAISQMASKGTVSMEELRGQLGEALPGAMKAAADGAGLTVEQLVAMVSTGTVLAKDLLPALTKGLNDLYGKAAPPNTVISEWARLKNVMTDTATLAGESGVSKGIAKLLSGVGTVAQSSVAYVDVLGTSIGELAAAVATGNTQLFTAEQLQDDYTTKIRGSTDATFKASSVQTGLTAAQKEAGTSAQEAAKQQEQLAEKTAAAVKAFFQVKQQYQDLAKGSADYVAQVEKEVVARTAESSVLTQLVNVYGTEIEKRQVAVSVAQTQAVSLEKVASAKNTEALISASYVIRLQEQALATGDVTEATKKQIEESQKSAAGKQTEYERTDALAKAKRIEAEASKAQAQALQDNSARVGEYRAAVDAAALEVERLTEAHKQGKATDSEVIDGKTKLATATLLYRDALADATKKAELNITVHQRVAQLAQASIGIDIERVKAAQEVATAQGDNAKATQLATQMTNLQVQASQAQADAARTEAADIRNAVDQKEKELKANGNLTAEAKENLAARRQSADLKDLEAQKSDILTNKILALAAANKSETASLEAKNAALERTISAQEKANALVERAIELENKRLNIDKEGFTLNTAGQRVTAQGNTQRSVYEQAKGQGLSEAQALQISNQFIQNGQQTGAQGANTQAGENWGTELQKAIDKQVLANAGKTAAGSTTTAGATGPVNHTYTVNIPSQNASIGVNTEADAKALIQVLQSAKLSSGY